MVKDKCDNELQGKPTTLPEELVLAENTVESIGIHREQFECCFIPDDPNELPSRTRRALNIIAALGLVHVVDEILDNGSFMPSVAIDTNFEWGMDKEVSYSRSGIARDRFILEGRSVLEFCESVISEWARRQDQGAGAYTFDPEEGLLFTRDLDELSSDDDMNVDIDRESEPATLFAYRSEIGPKPRIWVEWVTTDWAHYGLLDLTDSLTANWISRPDQLLRIIDANFPSGSLLESLSLEQFPTQNQELVAAIDHIRMAREAGQDIRLAVNEISPDAILPVMMQSREGAEALARMAQNLEKFSDMDDAYRQIIRSGAARTQKSQRLTK